MVPVHWGAYELSFHDWFDPAERTAVEAEKRGVRLATPKLGELVRLGSPQAFATWWRDTPDFIDWSKAKVAE